MSSRKRARTDRLFRAGARALAGLIGGDPHVYHCPICGDGYEQDALDSGQLTLEHVPPRALGGRGLVLTCRECNTRAGHDLDSQAVAAERLDGFLAVLQTPSAEFEGRARVRINEYEITADVTFRDKTFVIDPVDRHTAPDQLQGVNRYFDDLLAGRTTASPRYEIAPRTRVHRGRARISALRSAYLAAFAKFGYRYVYNQGLLPIREQIQYPDRDVLRHHWLQLRERLRNPTLLVLREPVVALGVGFGTRLTLLSWYGGPVTMPLPDTDGPVRLRGALVPWPRWAEHALDGGTGRASVTEVAGEPPPAAPDAPSAASVPVPHPATTAGTTSGTRKPGGLEELPHAPNESH